MTDRQKQESDVWNLKVLLGGRAEVLGTFLAEERRTDLKTIERSSGS